MRSFAGPGARLLAFLVLAIESTATRVNTSIVKHRDWAFSLALSAIAFFPTLLSRGTTGGYLYTPDTLAWYVPTLSKLHSLISHGHLVALDYGIYNGSSDFFVSPIFPYFNPVVLLYAFLTPSSWSAGPAVISAVAAILIVHIFIACLFTLKVLQELVGVRFASACIGATLFAYSFQMLHATIQLSFVASAAFIPWAVYSVTRCATSSDSGSIVRAAVPVLFCLLGGYLPVAGFCVGTAALAAAWLLLLEREETATRRTRVVLRAVSPFFIVLVVVAPLLYSIYDYHASALSSLPITVELAAHDLAESPRSVLRFLWSHVPIPSRNFESAYYVGLPALAVLSSYLLLRSPAKALKAYQDRLFWLCAATFLIVVVATFGNHSALSDMFFYFLPQVGKMHNYARFLLPAQFLLAIAIALACEGLLRARPIRVAKVIAAFFVLLMFGVAYALSAFPEASKAALFNEYLVVEALFAAVVGVAFLAPGRATAGIVLWLVFAATSLDGFYDYQTTRFTLASQRALKPLVLDDVVKSDFITYLRRTYVDRSVIKYIDMTGVWQPGVVGSPEWFPKNYPGLLVEQIRLSSFSGYPDHVIERQDFSKLFPNENAPNHEPDWAVVEAAGAEFFVALEKDLKENRAYPLLIASYSRARPETTYRFSNGLVAVPFEFTDSSKQPASIVFANEVFRVVGKDRGRREGGSSRSDAPDFSALTTEFNFANSASIDFANSAPATVQYRYSYNPRLSFRLNGKRVLPHIADGLMSVDVPSGTNRVEVHYDHYALALFWLLYALLAATATACSIFAWRLDVRRRLAWR